MRHAFNTDGSDGSALDRAEEYAAQAGTDGRPESTLEGLGGKLTESLSERFGIGD
jgi:hypothetical protein